MTGWLAGEITDRRGREDMLSPSCLAGQKLPGKKFRAEDGETVAGYYCWE